MNKFKSLTSILSALILTSQLSACANNLNNSTNADWIELFNGKNLDNWTVKINHHKTGENYADTFRVEDKTLAVRYDQYTDFNQRFGHIFYNQPFDNFHLKFDYKFSGEFLKSAPSYAKRNSGVMFYSQSPDSIQQQQNWPISVEMQLLAELTPGQARPTGNMCSPGTDIIYQDKIYPGHCLNSNSKTYPMDQWVSAELIVNHGKITQIINGEIVLEYASPFATKDDLIQGEDPAIWQQMTVLTSGYIGFQSEGQPVEFKNIKIKAL
ncbi:DUF1080 domain-containing protein [Catenovulum sp. 2E275]|uniref:3-keto-disaccharide hydrolase n=1 Tax=Catenovulum sp. 2E275 TaxID=2980497 RepID=UPI0021D1ABC7|nr:DUF1080 domain-containing protein [Catenovulum sp. 2E275]MCU4675448.1 DUF1080 domain-containing protein [Catenovulum sp. 2E275]